MDSGHCCVCGREILYMDVYILRMQGKICSQCVLERGIPVGGKISRAALHRGAARFRERRCAGERPRAGPRLRDCCRPKPNAARGISLLPFVSEFAKTLFVQFCTNT
jgi:hypothetical protein